MAKTLDSSYWKERRFPISRQLTNITFIAQDAPMQPIQSQERTKRTNNHQVGRAIASFHSRLASASLWDWSRAPGTYSTHTHSILQLIKWETGGVPCCVWQAQIFLQRTSRPWVRSPVMHFRTSWSLHSRCSSLRDMICWQHILMWHLPSLQNKQRFIN